MKKIISILVVGILVLSGLGSVTMGAENTMIANEAIFDDNQPPEPPEIGGPSNGIVGQEYTFYFSTVDPEGHNVSFYVEWGDGTIDGWSEYVESGGAIGFSHAWFKQDNYFIRCKAKDILGKESDWSSLIIIMSKNKAFNFNFNLLQEFLQQFPILQKILCYLIK